MDSVLHWNTSKVTDMANMFKNNKVFDQYISYTGGQTWDVSGVLDMTSIFEGTSIFNNGQTKTLNYELYNGYYDGDTSSSVFNSIASSTGTTSNLTTIQTSTNNTFSTFDGNQSIKLTGSFKPSKTGTYRFFTYSRGKNSLEMNNQTVTTNTNSDALTTTFGNINLMKNIYYPMTIYYGTPDIAYPPIALFEPVYDVSFQSYGNGIYTTSSSSSSSTSFRGFRAFDYNNSSGWRSASNRYNSDRSYKGNVSTDTTNGPVNGEWLQIILPIPIILQRYFIYTSGTANSRPSNYKILGKNDSDSIWNVIDSNFGINTTQYTVTLNPIPTQSYNYYRIVIERNKGILDGYVQINEWRLYALPLFSSGYLEPNNDGTTTNSTDTSLFIQDATYSFSNGYYNNNLTQDTTHPLNWRLNLNINATNCIFNAANLTFENAFPLAQLVDRFIYSFYNTSNASPTDISNTYLPIIKTSNTNF
jgi:hypothetical protein